MIKNSVVIIGKGPSVLRCNREWVDQFETVAICNHVVFEGWQHRIGTRAHWWFRNWECQTYSEPVVKSLGLKKVINITPDEVRGTKKFRDRVPDCLEYEHFDIYQWFMDHHETNPTTGLRALEYCVRKDFTRIGMVGVDLYEQDVQKYYHDDTVIEPRPMCDTKRGHWAYLTSVFEGYPDINFDVISSRDLRAAPQ